MQGLSEAKDKAELELAERMRDDTDSESDGEDDDGGSEVGDLESMHGSRRKGKRGGSTTSSNHSSDHSMHRPLTPAPLPHGPTQCTPSAWLFPSRCCAKTRSY